MTREELIGKLKPLIKKAYLNRSKAEIASAEYDELTNFPELKNIIIDLLTPEFNNFLSSIDWVAPRPSTFRINLKNDQNFYLIYGNPSWVAQIEGKKYYLLNLPEEQRAAEALARILRYGAKESSTDEFSGAGDTGGGEEFGGGAGETTSPETGEETGGEEIEV